MPGAEVLDHSEKSPSFGKSVVLSFAQAQSKRLKSMGTAVLNMT